jgi:uncharacterized pyridoxamine 5'-phosphate oxidase family protein
MLQTALRFLDEHKEITLATCEGNLPKLRVFQVMKREGWMLGSDSFDDRSFLKIKNYPVSRQGNS